MQMKNGKERGFSVLQATESWVGPGNEATSYVQYPDNYQAHNPPHALEGWY